MGKHLLTIHGYKVYCDDDRAWHGVKHLAYEIGEEEAREMFHRVEQSREEDFEDDDHRHFTLVDGENNSFTVVTHDQPGIFS
jgi:hypothetical protein